MCIKFVRNVSVYTITVNIVVSSSLNLCNLDKMVYDRIITMWNTINYIYHQLSLLLKVVLELLLE